MRHRTISSVLLGVAVVVSFVPFDRLAPAKNLYWQSFASASSEATQVARESRSVIDVIRSIRRLHGENEDLRAENLRLRAELTELEETRHENEVLRGELGFVQSRRAEYDMQPARIIGRAASSFLQTVTIDQGLADGVAVDQAVVSQGFLVGRVVDVTEQTASVRLLTASRSKIPVILSESRASGSLEGGLAGLTAEELPNDIAIKPGEAVVTSGLGGIVPSGLPVGTVTKLISSESDIVQRAEIHSPVSFSKLETLLVVKQR